MCLCLCVGGGVSVRVANLAVFWLKLNLLKGRYTRKAKRKSAKLYLNDSEIRSFGVIVVYFSQFSAVFTDFWSKSSGFDH